LYSYNSYYSDNFDNTLSECILYNQICLDKTNQNYIVNQEWCNEYYSQCSSNKLSQICIIYSEICLDPNDINYDQEWCDSNSQCSISLNDLSSSQPIVQSISRSSNSPVRSINHPTGHSSKSTSRPKSPDRPKSPNRPKSPDRPKSRSRPKSPDRPKSTGRSKSPDRPKSTGRSKSPDRSTFQT
jgi:hypothetical protein